MNWLDIGILVVIGLSVFNGLRQGLIKAVLSFVGLIVGVTLASRFYTTVADLLTFLPQRTVADVAAFMLILVVILIVTSILAGVLTKVASAILLGWLNRLGGAVFGFLIPPPTITGIVHCSETAFTISFGTELSAPLPASR